MRYIGITINERTPAPSTIPIALKPCPLCGGEAHMSDTGHGDCKVFCADCHASVGNDLFIPAHSRENAVIQGLIDRYGIDPFIIDGALYTKDINRLNAIEKWNRRKEAD